MSKLIVSYVSDLSKKKNQQIKSTLGTGGDEDMKCVRKKLRSLKKQFKTVSLEEHPSLLNLHDISRQKLIKMHQLKGTSIEERSGLGRETFLFPIHLALQKKNTGSQERW